ncbi:MAG TPA: AAA family ATPase [Solirubrobacteraceae bacterium]|nr:AAA family ATPase [Solirubrobacteraceae bacterium]
MRITALELAPYGHLTNARLEFPAPAGGPGLHIIEGRNGAGKSTSLRALNGALFGIPRRTRDTHTHIGPALKIALSLEGSDGRLLHVERRKKDTQSLSTSDGAVVDEALLREYLGGLPPEEFRAMFLLDCEKLEKGSEDLVAGRGLLGEALFGAALGLGQVHKVLADLDAEADALWLKGGQRTINRQLKALSEARKDVRAGRLTLDAWVAMGRELRAAEDELVSVRDELRQHTETVIRSERYERCLAPLGRRRLTLGRLEALPAVAEVPASLPQEARDSANVLKEAQDVARDLREQLQIVELELGDNPDPGAILDREDAINALYKRAGEIGKANRDLPRREAELAAHEHEIRILYARARPGSEEEDVAALRVGDAERALVDEYAGQRPELDRVHTDSTRAVDRLEQQIEKRRDFAPAKAGMTAAAIADLSAIVDAAGDAGDLDSAVRDSRERVSAFRASAERGNAAITHWDGTVEELERLKVPSAATMEQFSRQFSALDRAGERLDDRDTQLRERGRKLAEDDAKLKDGPVAPLRSEVSVARRVRDDALNRLIESPVPEARDADAVHAAVQDADDLADSRADHGEAAAARENLERERAALADSGEQLRLDHEAHADKTAGLQAKWAQVWAKLSCEPGTVEEMRLWITAREKILADLTGAREQEGVLKRSEEAVRMHISAMVGASDGSLKETVTLTATIRAARVLVTDLTVANRDIEEHEREQMRLLEELQTASENVNEAVEARIRWDTGWTRVTGALGLAEDATTAQAKAQLACIDELVSKHDAAVILRRRICTIQKDQQDFECDAHRLASELAPALGETDAIKIADVLHAEASKAGGVRATRAQLEPRARELSKRLKAIEGRAADARDKLELLSMQAGVSATEIAAFCETAETRAELLEQLEKDVNEIEAAGGQPVAELDATLAEVTPEALSASKADAEAQVDGLEARRGELEQTIGRLRSQLEQSGSEEAALAAERESQAAAEVVEGFERYSELRLAAHALRTAMEHHRREHQGPLLKRAGELFAALSANNMAGLTAVTTERDPYLMGVLPDKREVHVEDMSAGQRHQLFLALRLASLERHFATGEPMPLVLDDLLVQLDDTSGRAALEILSEISRKTQVLFFTHHHHLLEMARETVPADLLVEHRIGGESRSTLRAA